MILLLSPAKSLDFDSQTNYTPSSTPLFKEKAYNLVQILKNLSATDLQEIFGISEKLSQLNFARFQSFVNDYNSTNSRQAILAFNGDVYNNIKTKEFGDDEFQFAQEHILILSGLYGLLRPLDLIQPYRLEMGTNFANNKFFQQKNIKDLYQFWQDEIVQTLNKINLDIVNLASNEYFSVVNRQQIKNKIIDIVFKEKKNGSLKIIGINAKRARGMMANFAIKNKIIKTQDLKKFNQADYKFDEKVSSENEWVFTR